MFFFQYKVGFVKLPFYQNCSIYLVSNLLTYARWKGCNTTLHWRLQKQNISWQEFKFEYWTVVWLTIHGSWANNLSCVIDYHVKALLMYRDLTKVLCEYLIFLLHFLLKKKISLTYLQDYHLFNIRTVFPKRLGYNTIIP